MYIMAYLHLVVSGVNVGIYMPLLECHLGSIYGVNAYIVYNII